MFCEDLYTKLTISLQGGLHHSHSFISLDEDTWAFLLKQNTIKQGPNKSAPSRTQTSLCLSMVRQKEWAGLTRAEQGSDIRGYRGIHDPFVWIINYLIRFVATWIFGVLDIQIFVDFNRISDSIQQINKYPKIIYNTILLPKKYLLLKNSNN